MVGVLVALLAEALVGGRMVCSEAHTLPHEGRVAVAATVRTRVVQTGETGLAVMGRPGAYAPHLCPLGRLEGGHVAAYVEGRLGLGPRWTRKVVAFYHRRLHPRLGARWRARGWRPIAADRAHVYWEGEVQ